MDLWFFFRDLFIRIIVIMQSIKCFGIDLWTLTLGSLAVTFVFRIIKFFYGISDIGDDS